MLTVWQASAATRDQAAGSAPNEEPPLRNQFNYNDRGTQARSRAVLPPCHAVPHAAHMLFCQALLSVYTMWPAIVCGGARVKEWGNGWGGMLLSAC